VKDGKKVSEKQLLKNIWEGLKPPKCFTLIARVRPTTSWTGCTGRVTDNLTFLIQTNLSVDLFAAAAGNDPVGLVLPPVIVGGDAATVQLKREKRLVPARERRAARSHPFLQVIPRPRYGPVLAVEPNGSEHLLLHGRLHSLAEHVAQDPSDQHHDEYDKQYDEILQQYEPNVNVNVNAATVNHCPLLRRTDMGRVDSISFVLLRYYHVPQLLLFLMSFSILSFD
jgi:hypothetical protein